MEKQGLKEKIQWIKLGILASIPEAIAFCNALVVQASEQTSKQTSGNAVEQKVEKSSLSIWGTMKLISMSILVIVLGICGLILMIGTQKMKDGIKEHFYSIAAGVAVLFLAQDIADWCEGVFG